MNTIKFEVGKKYRDTNAYGEHTSVFECVSRTEKTVRMFRDDGRKFTIRVVEFRGEEVARAQHILASNVA